MVLPAVPVSCPGHPGCLLSGWQDKPLYHTIQLAQRWPLSAAKSGPPAPASGRGKCRQDVLSCGRQVLSHEPLLTLLATWQGAPPLATRTCACLGLAIRDRVAAELRSKGRGCDCYWHRPAGQGRSPEPLSCLQHSACTFLLPDVSPQCDRKTEIPEEASV